MCSRRDGPLDTSQLSREVPIYLLGVGWPDGAVFGKREIGTEGNVRGEAGAGKGLVDALCHTGETNHVGVCGFHGIQRDDQVLFDLPEERVVGIEPAQ